MKINFNIFKPYKDVFNIYNLITKINSGYKLFFNLKNKKFYILNTNKNNEICLIINGFSQNILQELQFSRIENLNENMKNIEAFNENLSSKNYEISKQISLDKIKEIKHNINRCKSI